MKNVETLENQMRPAKERRRQVYRLGAGNSIKRGTSGNIRVLLSLAVVLLIIGTINLYSAALGTPHFYSQLKSIVVGIVAFGLFAWLVPLRHINSYAYWLYGIVCVMLAVVMVVGHVAGGSQRWIELGPIRGQPSEFAKLACAVVVARFFLTNRLTTAFRLRDLWPLGLIIGAAFALIFEQPDLGTAGVCLLIVCSQLAFLRLDWRSIGLVAGAGISVATGAWLFLLRDYQKLRVLTLFHPELDPHGSGYHAIQSLVAIGSGGVFGKGFLQGTQTHMQFLPERHTDFIFSVFTEEHGFIGGVVVLCLFAGLTYAALGVARQAKNTFSGLLALGIAALFFVEYAINSAMVLGLFPVVGVPLPFFSHGGSSLLTVCTALGLLVSIDRETWGRSRKSRAS